MPKATFDTRFKQELAKYAEKYDIESLANPNDISNLHTIIRNSIVIAELQQKLNEIAEDDPVGKAMDMKKINDSIVALTNLNIQLERQLSIDRKTRKAEQETSVADVVSKLKLHAKEFLDDDERLKKVHCPKCKIMVGRISGVYKTTFYHAEFQCPQCNKKIVIKRQERDYLFDVKDADWRRPYPAEIIQPKGKKDDLLLDHIPDDLILEGDINGDTDET